MKPRLLAASVGICLVVPLAPSIAVHASEPATAGPVVEGQIFHAGAGKAGRAMLRVWPDTEALAEVAAGGDPVPFLVVQPGASTPDGRFSIDLPFDLPADYVDPAGYVQIEAIVSDGTHAQSQNVTVAVVDAASSKRVSSTTRAWVVAPDVDAAESTARGRHAVTPAMKFQLNETTLAEMRTNGRRALPFINAAGAQRFDHAEDPTASNAAAPGLAPLEAFGEALTSGRVENPRGQGRVGDGSVSISSGGGCSSPSPGAEHGPYNQTFAYVYGTAYAKGRVDTEVGGSHTLGMGVKYGSGSWGADGTETKGHSWGYDTGDNIVDARVWNRLMERYWYASCITSSGTYTTTYTKFSRWWDGPHYQQVSHVNYSTCSTAYSGTRYWRSTNANGSFSAGLTLPFISLYSQSGWTSSQRIATYFWRGGRLCGSGTSPWTSAPRFSAYA